ncbi:MAG: hypothetical protein KGZ83_01645 [Sulfuricella sp.]|nr:hypothetical protein [Sulfuricella sp.]
MPTTKFPLREKYNNVSDLTHTITSFLNWMEKQKGLRLCEAYKPQYEWYTPICGSKEELALEFFGIDLAELENENWLLASQLKNAPESLSVHASMN